MLESFVIVAEGRLVYRIALLETTLDFRTERVPEVSKNGRDLGFTGPPPPRGLPTGKSNAILGLYSGCGPEKFLRDCFEELACFDHHGAALLHAPAQGLLHLLRQFVSFARNANFGDNGA